MVSATASFDSSKAQSGIWGDLFDFLLLGGWSLLLLPFFLWVDHAYPTLTGNSTCAQLLFVCAVLVNHPHNAATYQRVYGSLSEIKKYPFSAIVAPLVLIAVVLASYVYQGTVAPWLFKAYLLTTSYHYAGQSYGVGLILARKSGINLGNPGKLCLSWPLYTAALLWVVGDETVSKRWGFANVPLPHIGFPDWLYLVVLAVVVTGIFAYGALNIYLHFVEGKRLPLAVHATVISHVVWFCYGPKLDLFIALIPFFHSLQYLAVTSYFHRRELIKTGKLGSSGFKAYLCSGHFLKYYVTIVAVAFLLLTAIPQFCSGVLKICDYFFAWAVIASGVSLHHFLLDGEIWKLRKPEIGKLLVG